MAGRWKVIPHTADLALAVSGESLEDVLRAAALGLWSVSWDVRRVRGERTWDISAEGRDAESLLVNFLNELIFHHETGRVIWRELEHLAVQEQPGSGLRVRAVVKGEALAPHHRLRREVKAATLHGLCIARRGGRLSAQVVFDL
ncbi:MAG: archease [Bacillota bacterium]|nr:archease [Bacillota bacterium]